MEPDTDLLMEESFLTLQDMACTHQRLEIRDNEQNKEIKELFYKENLKTFYFNIRSNNVKSLDVLINKWKSKKGTHDLNQLEKLLAKTYKDLNLKNVKLSDSMRIYVKSELVNLRFFSNSSVKNEHAEIPLVFQVKKRIDIVITAIEDLFMHSNTKRVDIKYLFICKFIARNIRILKRQLPFTYKALPWEEIEFCLVSFISSYTTTREINFVFKTMLDKQKLLEHLKIFTTKLNEQKHQLSEKCFKENFKLPEEKREDIVKRCSDFKELYDDYEKMRDIYSLKQMEHHISLVLSDDIDEGIKHLVVERTLQVIGEHLKDTLTSPNLSSALCETIFHTVSQGTNKILKDLRDSLSHFHSLRIRLEIEKDQNSDFFSNVMNDLRKIGVLIADIFYKYKISMVKRLMKKLADSATFEDTKDVIEVFESIQLDQTSIENINIKEYGHAEEVTEMLQAHVETDLEKELLSKINGILLSEKKRLARVKLQCSQYLSNFLQWKTNLKWENNTNDGNKSIKTMARNILKEIFLNAEHQEFRNVLSLVIDIANSFEGRLEESDYRKIEEKIHRFFYAIHFEIGKVQWIEDFKKRLAQNDIAIEEKQAKLRDIVDKALGTLKENMNLQDELYNILINELENKMSEQFNYKMQFDSHKKKLVQLFDKLTVEVNRIRKQYNSKKELKENLQLLKEEHYPVFINLLDLLIKVKLKEERQVEDKVKLNKIQQVKGTLKTHFKYYDFDNGNKKLETVEYEYSALLNSLNNPELASQEFQKFLKPLNIDDKCKKWLPEMIKTKINDQAKEIIQTETQTEDRLTTLKRIFNLNVTTEDLVMMLAKDEKLQAAVKLIVLDIIEDLKDKNILNDNRYFLDCDAPVLVGNQLRNYLAHGDPLLDVLGSNPLVSVVSHAKEILKNYSSLQNGAKIGETTVNDLSQVENQYARDLNVVTNQMNMFIEAESGNVESVKECLQNGADINAKDVRNWNALHYAARSDNLETMTYFLDMNLSIDDENAEGEKPLHIAAGSGGKIVAFFVSNKHIDVNLYNNHKTTILHYAARNGNIEVVQTLLDHQAKVDAVSNKGWTPLHLAAQNGHLAVVASLIDNGALVDSRTIGQSVTALHIAALNGHCEVTRYLIVDKNADLEAVDTEGFTPLHLAATNNHIDIVNALLDMGAHVNAQIKIGWTPLHLAAQHGYFDVVNVLLQHNASVHVKTNQGATPLHVTAQHSRLDICLIESGENVNSASENHMVPLNVAAQNSYEDTVDVLLTADGIDVNDKDILRWTPLHCAAYVGNKKIVETLLSNSADIHARTNENFTPLHYSAQMGHIEVIHSLILNGANVNAGATENNVTPLYIATQNGHLGTVCILLKNGAKIDTRVKPQYATSLHIAAEKGYFEILNLLLLENDINIDLTTDQGWTPLHIAAQEGQVGIVAALLKKGAMVDAKTNKGWTPLHIAVQTGHLDVVNALLKANAKIDSKSSDKGTTPIYYAALNGHLAILELLLENNAKIDDHAFDGSTPLHAAALYNHLDIFKYLVAKERVNFNVSNIDGWTPLWTAVLNGHLLTVKYLIEQKCEIEVPDSKGWNLLHIAALRNHLGVLTTLLQNGADVNSKTKEELGTPLHIASRYGHVDIVKALVKQGANVDVRDVQNWTPLHAAAEKGHQEVIETLLTGKGANADAQTNLGMTPLHIAAINGHQQVVLCLIEHGACIDALTKNKNTPLLIATDNCHIGVVNTLLENGADANVASIAGWASLHVAANKGRVDILKALLEKGADPKQCTNDGWTALHIAAHNGNVDVFKVLLDTGVNFFMQTHEGYTPLYLAANNNHISIAEALFERAVNIR